MEARKMSKNRAEKFEAVAKVMAKAVTWDAATTPEEVVVAVQESCKSAKKKMVKMSGMTAYLIMMEMVETGDVLRKRVGRVWKYAMAVAGADEPVVTKDGAAPVEVEGTESNAEVEVDAAE